jgi:isoleucyl-tRNA synthetase
VHTLATIIKEELNVKSIRVAENAGEFVDYRVRPRFDLLGPKYGKLMRHVVAGIETLNPREIATKLEREGSVDVPCGEGTVSVLAEELVVDTVEQENFAIESEGDTTCALRTALSPELVMEGLAREMVNKIQTMRKEADFNVEDRIVTVFWSDNEVEKACLLHKDYIMEETLSRDFTYGGEVKLAKPLGEHSREWDLNGHLTAISLSRKEVDGFGQRGSEA